MQLYIPLSHCVSQNQRNLLKSMKSVKFCRFQNPYTLLGVGDPLFKDIKVLYKFTVVKINGDR